MGSGCVSRPVHPADRIQFLNGLIIQSSSARNFSLEGAGHGADGGGECLLFFEHVRGLKVDSCLKAVDPPGAFGADEPLRGASDEDPTASLESEVEEPTASVESTAAPTGSMEPSVSSSPSSLRLRQRRFYIRAWAESAEGDVIGRVAEWPAKLSLESPSWYSAQPLGFALEEHRSARLHVELRELKIKGALSAGLPQRGLSADDVPSPLGSLSAPLSELPEHSVVTRKLESKAASLEVTFQLLKLEAVAGRRTVYFVRHAESEWNVAQSSRNLFDMVRTTDHPLSDRGLRQAEDLSARAAAAADQGDPHGTALHQADVVYVSPLTRTVQTAVISLGPLVSPDRGPRELVLMANARERQGMGGMDTRSKKIGLHIVQSSFDSTRLLYANRKCANAEDNVEEVFKPLRFDVSEVLDRWWCETTKESDAQLQERLREFMAQLMYSPCKTAVVVGHSLFFREVFRGFLSREFRDGSPELARALRSSKLANCGVACLHLEPARGLTDGPITHVELVLGSQVESVRASPHGQLAESEGDSSPCKTGPVGATRRRSPPACGSPDSEVEASPSKASDADLASVAGVAPATGVEPGPAPKAQGGAAQATKELLT